MRDRLKRAIQDYNYKTVNNTFKSFEALVLNTEIKLLGRILEDKSVTSQVKNMIYVNSPWDEGDDIV